MIRWHEDPEALNAAWRDPAVSWGAAGLYAVFILALVLIGVACWLIPHAVVFGEMIRGWLLQ